MAPPITCQCGTCGKCKRRVYMREYYRRHPGVCRRNSLASRARTIDRAREYDRNRGHRLRDAERERAGHVVYEAIKYGRLVREPCEVCGADKVDAHHEDYSRPLDVRWLCRAHHMELHRTVAA